MKEITKKWIELAEYDLASAKVMLDSKRYLYVAFMCQQALEKYLKSILTESSEQPPPYTHNLVVLADLSGAPFAESDIEFLSKLSRHYINARYPGIKEELSSALDNREAKKLYEKTEDIIKWLKKKSKTSKK